MKAINQLAQSMNDLSDKQLVERVIGGDKASYGALVNKYSTLVYRRALTMLKDCDAAMDVTQQCFLIGYENLDRLRNPSSFAHWIAGITKNLCRGVQKKQKDSPLSLDALAEVGIEPGDPGTIDLQERELREALDRIISRLREKHREVLDLRCTRDFSYEKIADFLGISMSAVKSRLYHAKKEVLKKLKREGWI
jgi:RNA polymerase sigma-70 factor (ECF subfamily)